MPVFRVLKRGGIYLPEVEKTRFFPSLPCCSGRRMWLDLANQMRQPAKQTGSWEGNRGSSEDSFCGRVLMVVPAIVSLCLCLFHELVSQCLCVCSVAHSCPTLCDPMDCSPPGASVPGILQAWILEWVAMPSSRGSSWPRIWTCASCVSCIAGRFFTAQPPGKPLVSQTPWKFYELLKNLSEAGPFACN